MIAELKKLSADEQELVYKAPILVCILIAGADGTIDRKEIKEAIQFAEKKISSSKSPLSALLIQIMEDFEDKLKILLQQFPYKSKDRNQLIASELIQLNSLWKKMDSKFAKEFFNMLVSISQRIANSSGGILGYNAVGSEEAKYVNLGMINDPSLN